MTDREDPWVVVKVITPQGEHVVEHHTKSLNTLEHVLSGVQKKCQDDYGWLYNLRTGRIYNPTLAIENVWRDVYPVNKYYLLLCGYYGVSSKRRISLIEHSHIKNKSVLFSGIFQTLLSKTRDQMALEFFDLYKEWIDCSAVYAVKPCLPAIFYWSSYHVSDNQFSLYHRIRSAGGINAETCAIADDNGFTALHNVLATALDIHSHAKWAYMKQDVKMYNWNIGTTQGTPVQYALAELAKPVHFYETDEGDTLCAKLVDEMNDQGMNFIVPVVSKKSQSLATETLLTTAIRSCQLHTLNALVKRFPEIDVQPERRGGMSVAKALASCYNMRKYERNFPVVRDIVRQMTAQYNVYFKEMNTIFHAVLKEALLPQLRHLVMHHL